MGLGPSKTKSKPMRPARAEPAWLDPKSHGDAFCILLRMWGTVSPGFDEHYQRDKNDKLDPIGRLTYVTDGGAERPNVEYTYTWPVPTEAPLAALEPIWHCTQYTARVDYRDKGARDRLSTLLPEGRAFRLAHAREQGTEFAWSRLENRTLLALNERENNRGKSVWEKWRGKQAKSGPAFDGFQTAEETMKRMVGHIKEIVEKSQTAPVRKQAPRRPPVEKSGAASAPNEGGKRESLAAQRAEKERAERRRAITSVLYKAYEHAKGHRPGDPLGKGWLVSTLGELLRALPESYREETKSALYGLHTMAEKLPVDVFKFLNCFVGLFVNNNFPTVDGNRILLARCSETARPLLDEFSLETNRTATYMRNIAVLEPNHARAFFSALVAELKREAGL